MFSVAVQSGISPRGRVRLGASRVPTMEGRGGEKKQQAALSKLKSITQQSILSELVLPHGLFTVTKES